MLNNSQIKKEFMSVPNDYRLNWFLLNRDADIEELKRFGIGGLTVCVPYKDYLKSAKGWENFQMNVRACTEAGISLWIMDEWGYPSGMAGGLVVEEDPTLESMGLILQKAIARGGEKVVFGRPAGAISYVYAAYYPLSEEGPVIREAMPIPHEEDSVRIRLPEAGKDERFAVYAFAKTFIFNGTHSEVLSKNWKYTGHYPNLLEKEATRRFIALTHENYKKHLPEGSSMPRIFYGDEPSLTTIYIREGARPEGVALVAWSDSLTRNYQDRYGEELYSCLPCLFEGMDDLSRQTRIRFYRLVADILREDWTGQITDWCEENGTNMSYHYFAEESMTLQVAHYADLMHVMEPMQIPSVDIRLCKPGSSRHKEITAVRQVASVARHSGDKQTRAELDPILGGFTDVKATMAAFRDNANYSFAMGLNNMTTYGNWKDNPEGSQALEAMSKYIGRIEMILRGTTYQNNIGIYYPIETYQAEYLPSCDYIWTFYHQTLPKQQGLFDLDEQLMQRHISASYISAQVIIRCGSDESLSRGILPVGKHQYDTLIMPQTRVLSLETAGKLMTFEKNGGCLIWYGCIPTLATEASETQSLKNLLAHCKPYESLEEVLRVVAKRNNTPLRVTTGDPEDDRTLTIQMFDRDGTSIAFIGSLSLKPLKVNVSITGWDQAVFYDPMTGEILSRSLPAKIDLGPSESVLIEPV
jgi:hypothetical protein